MLQVDFPAAFAVGQVFALLSKRSLKKEPGLVENRLLGAFNIYMACGFLPAGLYFLVGYPAWEVQYLTDWFERPFDRPLVAGAYVLFAVLVVVFGNLGFMLAHHWLRRGKDRWVVAGAVASGMLAGLPFLLKWGTWWRVGTYEEYHSGLGYSFWSPPFIAGWLVIMVYLVAAMVVAGLWFRRRGDLPD